MFRWKVQPNWRLFRARFCQLTAKLCINNKTFIFRMSCCAFTTWEIKKRQKRSLINEVISLQTVVYWLRMVSHYISNLSYIFLFTYTTFTYTKLWSLSYCKRKGNKMKTRDERQWLTSLTPMTNKEHGKFRLKVFWYARTLVYRL